MIALRSRVNLIKEAMKTVGTLRYTIAFPAICAHFQSCRHELCPEEFSMLMKRRFDYLYIRSTGELQNIQK